MSWYVFAIVDRMPAHRPARGLSAPLSFRRVGGVYAAIERRADVPPLEFGVLRTHQRIVCRLAAAVPAILPVRFGTLMEAEEIETALTDRDEEIAEALDDVRARVQFTWRFGSRSVRVAPRDVSRAPQSGTDYLRQLAGPAIPPRVLSFIRSPLRRLAAAEKYQAATSTVPQTRYHLVDKRRVTAYERAAAIVHAAHPHAVVTGPWPPYSFAAQEDGEAV